MLNGKMYETLKWIGLIALPGIATYVGTIGPGWGWQNVDQIVNTINATGVLIGTLICVSTVQYNKK